MDKHYNDFWFLYYKDTRAVSMDEFEKGLVWRRVEDGSEGFLTRQDALNWLEFLAGEKPVEHMAWRSDEKHYYFPSFAHILYTVRPMGIMYIGPSVNQDSPWYIGAMREDVGLPIPQSMTGKPFRFVVSGGSSATSGDYIVTM